MKKMKLFLLIIFSWFVLVGVYQTMKKMPDKTNFRGKDRNVAVEHIEFLHDLTYKRTDGNIISEQMIFDEIFSLIENAKAYILIDAFLFNSYTRQPEQIYRKITAELTEKLVKKKKSSPYIKIDFITDPINTVYGGDINEEIEKLQNAGVNVIVTDLRELPDSNPIYSTIWRTLIQWFGNSPRNGLVPHPFTGGGRKVTIRSYLDMINFKANHRKIFMADNGENATVIITSGNPHDGSAAHSNVALKITGNIWQDVYEAEAGVAGFTGHQLQGPPKEHDDNVTPGTGKVNAVFLTENQIKNELLALIRDTQKKDLIQMSLFYLADRHVIEELVYASERGVEVKIILDPNKDAFGFEKSGIPNRPVAEELVKRSSGRIKIRWYDTHGEQFHSKMTLIKQSKKASLILGSANLTRRNLNNFNLEANVSITSEPNVRLINAATDYFDKIWNNRDGKEYTLNYDAYREDSTWKRIVYLVQEYAGLSSF